MVWRSNTRQQSEQRRVQFLQQKLLRKTSKSTSWKNCNALAKE